MPASTLSGLGLKAGWDPGEVGWGDDMNDNIALLSALTQARVRSRVTTLPGSGALNDIYIIPSGAEQYMLAIWDTVAADWRKIVPTLGMEVFLLDEAIYVYWEGTDWVTRPVGNSSVSTKSANYTLTGADFHGDKIIVMDSGAAVLKVTIPAGLSVTEPVTVIRGGAEKVTFEGAVGVTLHSADNIYSIRAVWAGGQVVPIGVNEYVLIGDLGSG